MKRFLFLILIILTLSALSQAQEKQWTLDACIQYAVKNSPKVNMQKAQNIIYQQDYINAIGKLLPTLNAGANAFFNFGRGVDSETNTYTNISSFSNSYSIYSNCTIFEGFSTVYRIKMQKINALAGKQQLEQEQEMVAFNTMETFFNVLYYKQLMQLAYEQAEESANTMRQAKRMEELGMKSAPDVAEMAAKEAADIFKLTQAKNMLAIGIILLKEKMNFPVDETLDISDAYSGELIIKSNETALAIYETAKTINPKALNAASALKVQEMNRRSAGAGFSPALTMETGLSSGFVKYLDGSDFVAFSEQLRNKRGTYIGFTLHIPLLNGFSSSTSFKKSKAEVIIAQNKLQETLRTLYSEIEQAVADMNGQADACRQAVKQREAMGLAHEANQRKYENGLISPLELHTSANRLVQAKAEEMNAILQYRLKERLVRFYKGESFVEL